MRFLNEWSLLSVIAYVFKHSPEKKIVIEHTRKKCLN